MLYYVMPYAEGESLLQRLDREQQLPVDESIRIAIEVADGLDYAHRKGVVHRDIKPGNILLSEHHAVIADFGIARAIEVARADRVTSTGLGVGTPLYASPEQATAQETLDGRTDIYSLGCVLYEMLSGEVPLTGSTPQMIRARRMSETPTALHNLRDTVPPALDHVIAHALALIPADRYATAAQFGEALKAVLFAVTPAALADLAATPGALSRPALGGTAVAPRSRKRRRRIAWGAVASLLILVGAAYALVPVGTRAKMITLLTREDVDLNPQRIVVAPLENRTNDSTLDALGQMAADWLTRGLTATGDLEVVDARTALINSEIVRQIPRFLRHLDVAVALARETGAGTVVSGNLYAFGDSLRLEMQVVDAASGTLLRALDPVAGSARNPSELVGLLGQRTVAGIAAAVDSSASGFAAAVGVGQPPSYAVYREVSRSWESYLRRDTADFFIRNARAIALDSTYVPPMFMRAQALSDYQRWEALDSVVRRIEVFRETLTLSETAALEAYQADLRGDLPGKLRAVQEMVRFLPGSAEVPLLAAYEALFSINRPREALAMLAQTDPERGLNIVFPHYWRFRTDALHALGDYEAELESVRQGLRQFPGHSDLVRRLLRALAALSRIAELEGELSACDDGRGIVAHLGCRMTGIQELRTHGHQSEAHELANLDAARFWPAVSDTAAHLPWLAANLAYEAGRWEEARAIGERLLGRDSSDVDARGLVGVAAVRLGDRAAAEQAALWLGNLEGQHLQGSHTMWRARIRAVLGEAERAVELLRLACRQGQRIKRDRLDTPMLDLHTDIDFASLRGYGPLHQLMAPQD